MTMPKFEPVATAMVNQHGTRWMHWKANLAHGTNLHPANQLTEAYEAGKREAPREAIGRILAEMMDTAVVNGADSRSMPDDYVAVAAWLCNIDLQEKQDAIPEGWVLVPKEPTDEQIRAMENQWMCGSSIDMAKREYKAMLAAAPKGEE